MRDDFGLIAYELFFFIRKCLKDNFVTFLVLFLARLLNLNNFNVGQSENMPAIGIPS